MGSEGVMQPNLSNPMACLIFKSRPLRVKPMTQKTPKQRYWHSHINPVNVFQTIFERLQRSFLLTKLFFLSAPDCEWPSNPPHPGCLVTSPVWLTVLLLDFLTIQTIIIRKRKWRYAIPMGCQVKNVLFFLFYAFFMQIQHVHWL